MSHPTNQRGRRHLWAALGGALLVLAACLACVAAGDASGPPVSPGRAGQPKLLCLTYGLKDETLHWPANKGFKYRLDVEKNVTTKDGQKFHIRADSIEMAIHSGTHLDAPAHFTYKGSTVERIPLSKLFDVPLVVVDLSAKVAEDREYVFQKGDFLEADGKTPRAPPGSVVLVYTGISDKYDQGRAAYMGCRDEPNCENKQIPGWGAEAAQFMVDSGVVGVGLDSVSLDSSRSTHFEAHKILLNNNVYGIENVNNNLKKLVAYSPKDTDLRAHVATLPIINGTGSPIRLVAVIDSSRAATRSTRAASGAAPAGASPLWTALLVVGAVLMALVCALRDTRGRI